MLMLRCMDVSGMLGNNMENLGLEFTKSEWSDKNAKKGLDS